MNTKVNEGKLISGKEALIALASGESVQKRIDSWGGDCWLDISKKEPFNLDCFLSGLNRHGDTIKFRLKPRTITINGIEVPKSSDTYSGGLVWILCGTDTREYTSLALDENDELPAYFWRTEEEIKQVVAALRQVFGGSHDN